MLNTRFLFNPLNWFIVFFMILIPCLGLELILDRKENGCSCGSLSNNQE